MSETTICPRCGKPVKSIHTFTENGTTYYRFYHGNGKRCYVGPREYTYATRTQWRTITIRGAVETGRELNYINEAIKAIREIEQTQNQETIEEELL